MTDNINNDNNNTNYDNDATTDANLKPGEEPATKHDITEGGILGAVGGAVIGAIAAGPLAPLGAVIGAVAGGIASAAAVDVVDKHDHDYNRTISASGTTATGPVTRDTNATLHGAGYDDAAATATTTNYDTDYDTTAPAGALADAPLYDNAAFDATAPLRGRPAGDDVVVPVVEEDLTVGKREVQGGGARVVSSVVETPVEQQVTLRDETVTVDRRPVDRPLTDADRAFQEGVLEVEETDEVPVVSKQARVVEEVVVGKAVSERTETIRDTVRRTDVDVQDLDARDVRDVNTGR